MRAARRMALRKPGEFEKDLSIEQCPRHSARIPKSLGEQRIRSTARTA
jgi:hypothetical protein